MTEVQLTEKIIFIDAIKARLDWCLRPEYFHLSPLRLEAVQKLEDRDKQLELIYYLIGEKLDDISLLSGPSPL